MSEFKVGDVLERLDDMLSYMTQGKHYEVVDIDEANRPIVIDDDGERELILVYEYKDYRKVGNLKAEEHTGYFEICEDYGFDGNDELASFSVTVDKRGYETLKKMETEALKKDRRDALKRQIAKLQAELDALD